MTAEEARRLYGIAWNVYASVEVLSSRLRRDGDDELGKNGQRAAIALWEEIADATGHPVPDDVKRPPGK